MADRASFSLAYKAQTAKGTAATAPLKLLPVSSFAPGISFNKVDDDTIQTSGFDQPGRAGNVPLAPSIGGKYRPGAYDVLLAAMFQNAWATDTLTQASTRTYFTLEDRQADIPTQILFRDALPNTFGLTLAPNGLVDFTMGFIALLATPGTTLSASPAAADSFSPFDSWSGSLTYGGVSVDATQLSLTVSNNFEPQFSIQQGRYPTSIPSANKSVTGSMTLAFTGITRLQDALNDTRNALVFSLVLGGLSQQWTLPSVATTNWGAPVGTGAVRLQTIQFEAEAVSNTMVTVVRDTTP